MKTYYHIYRVLRSIIVSAIVLVVVVYAVLYILLSVPSVQNSVREVGENELSKLLRTEVRIEDVSISPFSRVVAGNVFVADQCGDTLLAVDKLGAGVSIYNLLFKQRLVFTYAEIIGLDGRLKQDSIGAPLNIQFIIDAFAKKDKKDDPSPFDLKIYNTVIRKSRLSFDLLSAEKKESGFDKNHIAIDGLTADIAFPRIKNNDFKVNVKRLALNEKCGFKLDRLVADVVLCDTMASLSDFMIKLPSSKITVADVSIKYSSLKNLSGELASLPFSLKVKDSYVNISDFAGFNEKLVRLRKTMNMELSADGTLQHLEVRKIKFSTRKDEVAVSLSGEIGNLHNPREIYYSFPDIKLGVSSEEISDVLGCFVLIKPKHQDIVNSCERLVLDGAVSGRFTGLKFVGDIDSALGLIHIDGSLNSDTARRELSFEGHLKTEKLSLGQLVSRPDLLGDVAFDVTAAGTKRNRYVQATVGGEIGYLDFKGYRYEDISADVSVDESRYEGKVYLNDENIALIADGFVLLDGERSRCEASLDVSQVNLSKLNLWNKYPDRILGFALNANVSGNKIDNMAGFAELSALRFAPSGDTTNMLDALRVESAVDGTHRDILLSSDLISGKVTGDCSFGNIAREMKKIFAGIFPALISCDVDVEFANDFAFDFTIHPDNRILELFKAPVRVIYPISIRGNVDSRVGQCALNVSVPYLQNKNKLIEATTLGVSINGEDNSCRVSAQTLLPNKKGPMKLMLDVLGANDRIDTDVAWTIGNKHRYSGSVNLSTLLGRDSGGNISAATDFNPSTAHINDTVWHIKPAKIIYADKRVVVENVEVSSDDQYAKINGVVSDNPDETFNVLLRNMNLDYIFETLAINNVNFGGEATGDFSASSLLTKAPKISTPGLSVKGFSYNGAKLGDAIIQSEWVNETQGITINADIHQPNDRTSFVRGAIFPLNDSLHLDFDTHSLDVRFLQPFMSAFTSKIGGTVSGKGTLYGKFNTINFCGRLKPEKFKIKIDYLNTEYSTSDSVIIKPDDIALKNIVVADRNGNTALLNGHIRHNAFHDARINLGITNAENLLCFDTDKSFNGIWYGTIYGTGSAFVVGEPGLLNIDVNMVTAPDSRFNFVLSDQEAAGDYKFITFVDRNKPDDSATDSIPEIVKKLRDPKNTVASTPTVMNLNLNVEATPQSQLVLVMDPVAGDRIRANGSGNLKLAYNSVDDALTMHGKYTLEKGNYNFTLQDIIIKDFTIKDGSSISFNGDPLAANLDISAIYSVNANLTDLDESFALDKDMNRTNVPVHAVLNARGEINQPEISFDLEFPTLTQDAYRKVRSIVSTDDMMNRQIIYLLALSRFYTPEYTGAQSNNNEWTSVASSTISSQLANILGQMSENWTIAPNFRSNKGDFSDVEVDVALSSRLLNNRLLLNGNFGYRDKTLNANGSTFIGDFDIEYLLTKNGNIRLKAYNHYNDQNYYVKSALTTQGVGIVFKHDFDRLFDFLKRKPRKFPIPADSVRRDTLSSPALPEESIHNRPMRKK